jgi:predicted transcriptional regulator
MVSDKIAQLREDLHFKVLHLLESRPDLSQGEIAEEVRVSLGAVNFCVTALIEKGTSRSPTSKHLEAKSAPPIS